MSFNDATYWLSAAAGQTTPTDGIAGATLTGGTIALVDRGSGDVAWQFSAGQATVAIPSFLLDTTVAGPGCTIALGIRVTTFTYNPGYGILVGVGNGALPVDKASNNPGLNLATGGTALAVHACSGNGTSGEVVIGNTVDHTVVIRFKSHTNSVSNAIETWVTTASRSGTAANGAISVYDGNGNVTMNTLSIAATHGNVVQIKDLVIFPSLKTDAEASSLADNGIRASMPAAGATVALTGATTTGTAASGTGPITVTPAPAGVNLTGASTTGSASSGTGAITVTAAGTGTVTSDAYTAYGSNAPLVGLTVPQVVYLRASDGATILSLINQVTNGAGKIVTNHSALVPGTWYMQAGWDPANPLTSRGFKAYQAV